MNDVHREKNVDLVFCIDATSGMENFFNVLKDHINMDFVEYLCDTALSHRTAIGSLRIKLVVFRDYLDNNPMYITRFFELPSEIDELEKEIKALESYGGSDEPENGLEALYYAFTSEWNNKDAARHITVLFTDADALDLNERKDCQSYPTDMVDQEGLLSIWNKLDNKAKRLIVYAPSRSRYEAFVDNTNRSIFYPVEKDNGLNDLDFEDIFTSIMNAIEAI